MTLSVLPFVGDKTAPIPNALASVSKILNYSSRDGYPNIGEVTSAFFKSWKACSHSEDHEDVLFFSVSLCKGFAICANPFMNRL